MDAQQADLNLLYWSNKGVCVVLCVGDDVNNSMHIAADACKPRPIPSETVVEAAVV